MNGAGYPESERLPNGQLAQDRSRQPDLSYSFVVPTTKVSAAQEYSYAVYLQQVNR
jgi:hypothetical protein